MKEINFYEIEIEEGMNVSGIIYASQKLLKKIKEDKTIQQIKNVATLPGIINKSIALPDAHQGYGFCIGGVAGFDLEKGVVSPGGVGYDINCGVRLLKTNLKKSDIENKKEILAKELFLKIPSGVGRGSSFQLSLKQLDELLEKGSKWLVEKGYGNTEDLEFCEDLGSLKANSKDVSNKAKKRGIGQLGTMGAGNHFVEIDYINEIFDKTAAKVFGLEKNQIVILIHCGSRGLGHQVASDYIKEMEEKYGFKNLKDRELVNAPLKSELAKKYLSAMNASANFAFANRHLISHQIRQVFNKIFPQSKVDLLYDVCHNIAKIEEHEINGKIKKICVHRKGATRSFSKYRKEIPKKYKKIGQPVILPGSMGTSSYVLYGTKEAELKTFGSCAHGAGRELSRVESNKKFSPKQILSNLKKNNILVLTGSEKGLSEEAPESYKDVDEVIKTIELEKLAKKVAKTKPLIVIKG